MTQYRQPSDKENGQLDILREQWEVTKNPVFAWHAIRHCCNSDGQPPIHLPDWCGAYLYEAAGAIMKLAYNTTDGRVSRPNSLEPDISPQKRMQSVPAALGLVRPGKNAFRECDERAKDGLCNLLFQFLREPPAVVCRSDKKRYQAEGLSAVVAEGELAGFLDVKEVSTVRRRLSRARKTLKKRPRKT